MGEVTTSAPVQVTTVTITSAQVLALFTTAVTVVQAPGAGNAILALEWLADYTFGGTPYTDHLGALRLQYSGTGVDAAGAFNTAGWWDQGASQLKSQARGTITTSVANASNKALDVHQDTANPTLGNGTVTITVVYVVVGVS